MKTPKPYTVYNGHLMIRGQPVPAIVATRTQKRAIELLDISRNEFKNYWSPVSNEYITAPAMANINTVLVTTDIGEPKNLTYITYDEYIKKWDDEKNE